MSETITIYDTSLRDGTQSDLVNLSRTKKLAFLRMLDSVGVDYVELGWPGSNEEDMQVFLDASKMRLRHVRISAFGSTRRINMRAEEDPNLIAILESEAPTSAIVGKTDLDHVKYQLNATPEQNLAAIEESIKFLKSQELEVFYDAEHFFDGFQKSKSYALETLIAAYQAGADCLVLCDTNGGTLSWQLRDIISETVLCPDLPGKGPRWGIHTHNDSDLGVANALTAVMEGVNHVQGTVNGYGERTGNSNLCSIIPNLMLKMGRRTNFDLSRLTELSIYFDSLAQVKQNPSLPFVGENAFTHKGGLHVDAMVKFEKKDGAQAYEHIAPHMVGNRRRYVISELSGKANVITAGKHFGFEIGSDDPRIQDLLKEVEELRKGGYHIGGREAEIFLLLDRHFGLNRKYFEIVGWNVQTEKTGGMFRKSNVILRVKIRGQEKEASYTGISSPVLTNTDAKSDVGPIRAIYKALSARLEQEYPHTFVSGDTVRAVNYEVELVEGDNFRVRIESAYRVPVGETRGRIKYREERWETLGVSNNIIEASVEAAEKAFHYILRKTGKSLTELLDEQSTDEDVLYLIGENFEFIPDDIGLMYRLDANYRRRYKSRRKNILVEIYCAYLETVFSQKTREEVGERVMECLRVYTRDPAFSDHENETSKELEELFREKLDPAYNQTKIGKYNRQFEYISNCLGSLIKRLNENIEQMGQDEEEIMRMKKTITTPVDCLGLMFKRYWKAHGEEFYARMVHWAGSQSNPRS